MVKGFFKFETNEVEFIAIRKAHTSSTMKGAFVYLPKKFAGKQVIIAVPAEKKGGDGNE